MRATFALLVAAFAVVGCNPPPPEKTVFDSQVRAVKKAKALEGQLQQATERQHDQAEAATAEPVPSPNPGYDYR